MKYKEFLKKIQYNKCINILFFLVLFVRIVHEIAYFDFDRDKAIQLAATVNLQNEFSYSIDIYSDLGENPFKYTITNWPPTYSFLIVLINYAFEDAILTSTVMDIFFLLLLLYSLFKLTNTIEIPTTGRLVFLSILLLPFNIFNDLTSTDLISTSLLFFSTHLILSNKKHNRYLSLVTLSIACLIKYSFIPFLILPGIYVLINQYSFKWKLFLASNVFQIFVTFFIIKFIFLNTSNRYDNYLEVLLNSISFSQLLESSPFLINGLFNLYNYPIIYDFTILRISYTLLNYIIIFILIKKTFSKNNSIFISIILLNISFILGMSIITQPIVYENLNWYFNVELRYFVPSFLASLVLISQRIKNLNYVYIILFLFISLINIYKYAKFFNQRDYVNFYSFYQEPFNLKNTFQKSNETIFSYSSDTRYSYLLIPYKIKMLKSLPKDNTLIKFYSGRDIQLFKKNTIDN